ncbi:hypothetical protein [Streptomyces sp. NPDC058739]|uniref:VMAP-C domain-containing protein n=1 Tax=Streptomyces sp. NPDC058739 TaxID=3346618 RepID=UPI0036BE9DA6
MERKRFDKVQFALVEAFVAVLSEPAGGLMREQGRQLWRQWVDQLVDGVPQAAYAVPRQEFLSVVGACAQRDEDLEGLISATDLVAPALVPHLRPLLDEWRAHTVYAGRDWRSLREALQLRLPELASLVSSLTRGRLSLPAHCGTPWQAFVHLADANAPAGGLPPSMVLLEHLAQRPELADSVGEIRAWNDHFAKEWQLLDGDTGLRALRRRLEGSERGGAPSAEDGAGPAGSGVSAAAAARPEPAGRDAGADGRPVIRVYIRIAPDRTPRPAAGRRRGGRPRYHVSACVRYSDSLTLHRAAGADPEEPVTREQLGPCVATLLTTMSRLWHNRQEQLVALEFFLPLDLLTEPIEYWDRDPTRGYANPLLSTYRISVHSLERVQRPELHRAWRARWAHWKAQDRNPGHGRRVVHECAWPEQSRNPMDHLAALDVAIGSDDDVVGVLLCEPPLKHGQLGMQEVSLALDLGVPIVMYHRRDDVAPAWRAAVRDAMAEEGLAAIPQRARQWKTEAAAARPVPLDPEAVRALGMIWDDPEHLLDGGPSAPATFVGGTD